MHGVGEDDTNAIGCSLVEGLRNVGVLVSVEDTPDLVVRATAGSAFLPSLSSPGGGSTVDQRERPAVKRVHGDQHGVTKRAPPMDEVAILCPLALCEDEELASRLRCPSSLDGWPGRRGVQLSPAVMRAAAAANSSCDRMGVPP